MRAWLEMRPLTGDGKAGDIRLGRLASPKVAAESPKVCRGFPIPSLSESTGGLGLRQATQSS